MRRRFAIVCMILLLALTGCRTTGTFRVEDVSAIDEEAASLTTSYSYEGVYDDKDAGIVVTSGNQYSYLVYITNRTDRTLILDLDSSALVSAGGLSHRMVDGSSNSGLSRSVTAIPGGTTVVKEVFGTSATLPHESGAYMMLSLSDGTEEMFKTVSISDNSTRGPGSTTLLGKVSVEFSKWHFLFLGNTKASIADRLTDAAEEKYGEGVEVVNIRYTADWSPASLFLYFDFLGYVEDVTATADVIRRNIR